MPIQLNQVFYTYNLNRPDSKRALEDISLTFDDHCFTALIGKTGSGKSTLIQHLNALLLPDSGRVQINEHVLDFPVQVKKNGKVNYRKMKKLHKKKLPQVKEIRKTVGIVFQFPEYQIFEETVLKDVSFGPKNFGCGEEEAIEKAKKALTMVHLDESFYERSPFELSGGEKRRVAIAGILAMEPDILVLDEPTVGLDVRGQREFFHLIQDLYDQGKSIILATHQMDVVLRTCSRVIVLDQGKVVLDSTPLKLFQDKEFLSSSSIEPPIVFSFAMSLIERGMPIRLENIRSTSTLAEEIARVKGGKQ